MTPPPGKTLEVRCFCSRSPLLAIAGRDKNDEAFIHMKVHKQRRLYGEMVATSGVVMLRCRECLRWHRIIIVKKHVSITESEGPGLLPDRRTS